MAIIRTPHPAGLHLVNCSTNIQPGGMTTAEVEAEFAAKFGDLSRYDQFMDYNVGLLTVDLDAYVQAFDADGVPYLPIEWADGDGSTYHGVLVSVPGPSQMVVEVMAKNGSFTARVAAHPRLVRLDEVRASPSALARAAARLERLGARRGAAREEVAAAAWSYPAGDLFTVVSVSRAAADLAAVDAFYSDGMQCTRTLATTSGNVTRHCYLWAKQGSTADVCFVSRPDDATTTGFTVGAFETMLKTVGENVIAGQASGGCNNKVQSQIMLRVLCSQVSAPISIFSPCTPISHPFPPRQVARQPLCRGQRGQRRI